MSVFVLFFDERLAKEHLILYCYCIECEFKL